MSTVCSPLTVFNGSIATVADSQIGNWSAQADFGLHGFTNLTHFDKVMGNLRWDLISKYITAGQNSIFVLDQFRGLRTFNGISGSTWIFLNTPVYYTGVRTTLNMDNAYNFFQQVEMFSEVVLNNRYQLVLKETADNENLLLNATIPARGSLCMEGYLNPVGDEFTVTLFHQMKVNLPIQNFTTEFSYLYILKFVIFL